VKTGPFEKIAPVCPSCRKGALAVSKTVKGSPEEIEEGLLECRECHHLFPIIDGIPILARELRRVVSEQILNILQRTDLSETTLTLLGECCGSGSPFDSQRQHVSSYAHGHWEDGSIAEILHAGLERLRTIPEGPILDLGCSVGRTTAELARKGAVIGADLNVGMLRVARRFAQEKRARYPRRVTGLIFEERDVPIDAPTTPADFWCVDALALPFRAATFGLVTSLNLIDCVQSPLEHLRAISEILRPGGAALVATPFDWAPTATPVEQWLGGHSRLSGPEVVRALAGKEQLPTLKIEAEVDGLEWRVRLHERAEMRYRVALFVLRKLNSPA
jgi:SAM-dependent methyltransferase/uncharacterized protein YbaR (Trm112 family)